MNAFLINLMSEFDVRVKIVQIFQKYAERFFNVSLNKENISVMKPN